MSIKIHLVSDNFTKETLKDCYITHKEYVKRLIEINEKHKIQQRYPVFPEHISENIVKFIIRKEEKIYPIWSNDKGDLKYKEELFEVKCFSSTGPSSFGPTEEWKCIYFLDATDWLNDNFICYKVHLSNNCSKWKSLKINSKESYEDQCIQKRRPRISFNKIKEQIPECIEVIFKGSISEIF